MIRKRVQHGSWVCLRRLLLRRVTALRSREREGQRRAHWHGNALGGVTIEQRCAELLLLLICTNISNIAAMQAD